MEVMGSVSAVVQVALTLTDKILNEVNRQQAKSGPKENVELLKSFLSLFQSFIRDQEARQQDTHVKRDLVNKIVELTANIEDTLDEFTFSVLAHWHSTRIGQSASKFTHRVTDKFPAKKLASQTEKIKTNIDQQKLHDRLLIRDAVEGSRSRRGLEDRLSHQFFIEEPFVGFASRRNELLQQLLSPDSERAMIQVVGPGGSGKTFLVKKVFEEPHVKRCFQCVAWIRLTSSLDTEVLVEELLKQTCSPRDRQIQDEAGNSKQILLRHLQVKRYLIVLDNVWKRQDYTLIVNNLLPANNSGSRIIITTRNSGLVDNPKFTHKLDGLVKEEAWILFCSRAFGDQLQNACPQELRAASKEIVDRCEGMPLAIVSVSSLLAKEQLLAREWESFNNRLGSELGSNSNLPISGCILQPSFADLPHELRSCFLYFSLFPENKSVSRGRLIRSWMAEGFLSPTDSRSPEEVAESYLNELVERSLVRVSESEISGRVRSCKLLRLHQELIVPFSENSNFVTVVGRKPEKRQQTFDVKARRLSVQSDNFIQQLSGISDLSRARTLFVFGKIDALPESSSFRSMLKEKFGSDKLKELFHKFRLLKVLDLQGVPLTKLPSDVGSLSLLKCLNLRYTNLESVPSSVKYLSLIETLDLKYTLVRVLPKWIIKLQNLRHLVASCLKEEDVIVQEGVMVSSASIGALSSLRKLSLVRANNYKGFEFSDLGKLVQLKKLGVVDLEKDCGIKLCNAIEKMVNLSKLDIGSKMNNYLELDHSVNPPRHIRSLHLKGLLKKLPSWILKLSSLVKVVLKWSKSNDIINALEVLGCLPSLIELEMVEYYTGTSMKFKAGTFKNLRKLHVERFDNLTEVVVESQALTVLESLTICKCEKLRPLPRSYPLRRLKELVLYELNDDFIHDIHRRIGEAELVGHIQNRSSPREIRSCRYVS